MTTTKMLGLLGLIGGLALMMAEEAVQGRPPKKFNNLNELSVFDGKEPFGQVIRDGDRFVAIRALVGDEKLGYLHNFKLNGDMLEVDDQFLGYDLRGKNKTVLVIREARDEQGIRSIEWELVHKTVKEESFRVRIRAKNGELKGWWIGLGSVEPAKKESKVPRDKFLRAPLILVKDKKDAAGFNYPLEQNDDGP